MAEESKSAARQYCHDNLFPQPTLETCVNNNTDKPGYGPKQVAFRQAHPLVS